MAFPTGWTKKFTVTCPTSWANGAASPGDVPVPFTQAITDWPADIFANARADGGDIRASLDADGATELALDVALWDPSNSKCCLWPLYPDYSYTVPSAVTFWYGKSDETMPAADSTYGREAVWACGDADDFGAALHLYEAFNNDPAGYLDSSTNDNDGQGNSMALTAVDGQVGKAQDFDGTADFISCADSATLSPTDYATISAWVKRDDASLFNRIFFKENSAGTHFVWGLQISSGDKLQFLCESDDQTNLHYGESSASLDDTNWHHVAAVFNSLTPTATLYVDGAASGSGTPGSTGFGSGTTYVGALANSTGPLTIGKLRYGSASYFHDGKIHDVRISSAERTAAYIYFEHKSAATQSAASAGSVTTIGGTAKPWYAYAQM